MRADVSPFFTSCCVVASAGGLAASLTGSVAGSFAASVAGSAAGSLAGSLAGSAEASFAGSFAASAGALGAGAMTGAAGAMGSMGLASTGGGGLAASGAGAAGLGAGGAAAIWSRALYSGGSSRKVYSRTRRPLPHCSSMRISTNGSLTGAVVVTCRMRWPPRRSSAKRIVLSIARRLDARGGEGVERRNARHQRFFLARTQRDDLDFRVEWLAERREDVQPAKAGGMRVERRH